MNYREKEALLADGIRLESYKGVQIQCAITVVKTSKFRPKGAKNIAWFS